MRKKDRPRDPSAHILSQVEAVLPVGGDGATSKEVNIMVGEWAHQTVKCALRALIKTGRARKVSKAEDQYPRFIRNGR